MTWACPLKPGAGVKVRLPSGLMETAPLLGLLTEAAVTLRGSPSASVSLPSTAMLTGVPCWVEAKSGFATGGSLTGVTLMVSVDDAVPPLPSDTV